MFPEQAMIRAHHCACPEWPDGDTYLLAMGCVIHPQSPTLYTVTPFL